MDENLEDICLPLLRLSQCRDKLSMRGFGDIRPREDGIWQFGYYGLRETFRVAAATADTAQAAV